MPDPINLLHVVRPTGGGIQTHVVALASWLPPSRFSQMVAGPLSSEFQAALSRARVSWASLPVPSALSLRPTLASAKQLRRLVEHRHAEIVHAHGFVAGGVAALALRGLEPRPCLVLTAHIVHGRAAAGRRPGPLRARAYRWLLGRVDLGIAVSHAARDAVLVLDPAGESRWRVIYNGLDAGAFRRRVDPGAKRRELGIDPAAAVVGVVARLSPEKGVDVFLRAAALVSSEVPNVDYVIVGEGASREELERLAHQLHLTGQALFLGRRRDVPEILAALDLLVVPSREESFGLVALEGVAAGVPVIASDIAGLREVFGGADVVEFVPADRPDALAEAIQHELTKVAYDEAEALELTLPGGGIRSLADMLVSQTEFNLDAFGLDRTRQLADASQSSPREKLLARFDIKRMVAATIEAYESLPRECR